MILLFLAGAVFFAAVWLVILYNSIVDFNHGISAMRVELKSAQAINAELKEKIFALLSGESLNKLTGERLVQEKNPEYIEVTPGEFSIAGKILSDAKADAKGITLAP